MFQHDDRDNANTDNPSANPFAVTSRAIVVLVAAMAAAWIAAGSTGLLAHPLRHALTWAALAVAIVAGWPSRRERSGGWLTVAVAVVLGLIMTAVDLPAAGVLAVALVTAALVRWQRDLAARVILIAALATAVLGVFRLACGSIPTVWLAADALGRALGRLAGMISGGPLWLGGSFGGVDFLVLMVAFYVGWLIVSAPPRLPRAICAAAAILAGHLIYLVVLSYSHQILAALPEVVLPPEADNSRMGIWAWGNAVRALLPWNLPLLALLIHAVIAAAMFRWATVTPVSQPEPNGPRRRSAGPARRIDALLKSGPAVLAATIPLLTVLGLSRSDLKGKTIVANRQGFLDWDRPQYDVESAGTYGMLEPFVASLGGKLVISADLSQADLDRADVLMLLHPNQDWSKQPGARDRIWEFVRRGGSLLLVADPEMHQGDLKSTFNEVLQPTAMRVRTDVAFSETLSWEHSCEALAHPATAGIGDRRNQFGLMMGSSIDAGWAARPLLVGRWAWSDPGSDALGTGRARYDPGEKLGDLVLAAEQPLGRGTVVVLADTASLHNDVLANSYPFTGRLLGYLAGRPLSPQVWWRQLLGTLAIVALVGLLAWRASPLRTGVAAAVLGGSLIGCVAVSHHTARVLPGSGAGGPPLACIDASHLEAYSTDTWGDYGIAGFSRTLIRSGYLPLLLPELTAERLEHAKLLISIGPARRFSAAERNVVREFVASGGTFICMAGAHESAGSRELLADFDFRVPPSPVAPSARVREPEPLGPFSLNIQHKGSVISMRSFAAWKVEHGAKEGWTEWVLGSDGPSKEPFVVSRAVGGGQVVVIGDTYLAVNQNLESAANVMRENVVFWRWLLTHVTDQEDWVPPPAEDAQSEPPVELPPEEPRDDSTPTAPNDMDEAKPPTELPLEDPGLDEPVMDDPAGDEVTP